MELLLHEPPTQAPAKSPYQGTQNPCSFSDGSLFQFVAKSAVPRPKYSPEGLYGRVTSTKPSEFPVFFPVTRESGGRLVRMGLHPPPVLYFQRVGFLPKVNPKNSSGLSIEKQRDSFPDRSLISSA
jgi:hypothetical protein